MKTKLYILFIATSYVFTAFSQSAAYREGLKKNIQLFETAKTPADFIKAANGFETLALSEKKEWLAFYYAGLCDALAAFEKPINENGSMLCTRNSYSQPGIVDEA